jgi:ankyrin repeat protein
MDSAIEFDRLEEEPLIGFFIKKDIEAIYRFVTKKNIDALTSALNSFHDKLIDHFNKGKLSLKSFPSEESAKNYFSQFLQHFFYSILQMDLELVYKKQILSNILISHIDNFYYSCTFNDQKITAFWIDKVTKDTALTAVAQRGDLELLEGLLARLEITFSTEASRSIVPHELEQYLFHENSLGRSALSLIWLKQDQAMERSLFAFASPYYGNLYSKTFERFLFQIDSEGNTAVIRAAARSSIRLFPVIFDNLARIFLSRNSASFRKLLLHENNQGETILHKVIQAQQVSQLELLFEEASEASVEFRSFFLLDKQAKKTPLIEAVKVRNKKIIFKLWEFASKKQTPTWVNAHALLLQQDTEGYTALMRAIEINYREGVNCFLNELFNVHWLVVDYDDEPILEVLKLRQQPIAPRGMRPSFIQEKLTVFQLAAKMGNWEILEELIDAVELVSNGRIPLTRSEINYVDENAIDTLTKLFREERDSRVLQTSGTQVSTLERKQQHRRLKLARTLARLGQRPLERNLVPEWASIEVPGMADRVINFFSIFCRAGSSSQGKKRSIGNQCFFAAEDYKISIPEEPLQQYKEALINILALIKQENLDSIEQVGIIRNTQLPSNREKGLLTTFSNVVTRYYNLHAATILAALKTNVVDTLEAAFSARKTYILLESQKDFLLIKNNAIFSGSLLNPIKFFYLDPTLSHSDLKLWLDAYFSPSYSLYPFNPELVQHYPNPLEAFKSAIVSDAALVALPFEQVKRQTLRELFLLDGRPIELSELDEEGFFAIYKTRLSFRAERFHEIFFKLTITDQNFLRRFIGAYKLPGANYHELSDIENLYLTRYSNKVVDLMISSEEITPTSLFGIAIDVHEALFSQETHLLIDEKNEIISGLRALKTKLAISDSDSGTHARASLQLLVSLFPSIIRGLAKRDPVELVTPIALITADIALREVLLKLINHPQVSQIFAGELASKALSMTSQTVERAPIIGSALAVYGLIQSGKALINTTSHDPNRPYYAHLLVNNLLTMGVMTAEMLVSLPFWPVLGLFALLTVDQLATEGGRIHDTVLHLEDDRGHPLLRFYRKLELGLSIVDADIQVVMEQRALFAGFLSYLDKVRNIHGADALAAVFLPAVRRVSVPRVVQNGRRVGCANSHAGSKAPVYPESPFCTTHQLTIEEKGDYFYELGKLKTFCEIRDPFYSENSSNYTVLVGSQSSDCSLGQTKTINALAFASSKNTAGILVNNRFRESNVSNHYRLFLSIDPFIVRVYQFKLFPMVANEAYASQNLEAWLPCTNGTVQCINQIRVAVTPLYSVFVSDPQVKTQINIDDNAVKKGNYNQGVRAIEYLLTITENVHITSNQIPEKTFAFFNNKHYLKFAANLLKSENNFQASLENTKKLTLELTDKAWIEGLYQVPSDQILIINQLKGKSEEKSTVLDVTHSNDFIVSLGQYTELKDRAVNISLQTKFNGTFLEVYRHPSANTFYQFLIPINKIWVVYPEDREQLLIYSSLYGVGQEAAIIKIKTSRLNHTTELVFSGKYEYKNKVYFSRIVMRRQIGVQWQCNLEINASAENDTKLFDLQALQDQRFSKVTVLTSYSSSYKKTHYLFYQFRELPIISGKFTSYRLLATDAGWLISLNHTVANEETKCFIGENTREVVIDTVRYELSPGLASMFAIGTLGNSPINGENLIAPLKIAADFSLCDIQYLQNATYQIGDIVFKNLALNTKIYFFNETLYFSYIQYKLLMNQNETASNDRAMNHLDGRQFLEMSPATERFVKKPWLLSHVTSFLLGAATLTTTFVGGVIFMLSRRFRYSTLPVSTVASVPLLEIPQTSAELSESAFIANKFYKPDSANLPACRLFEEIEGLKHTSKSAATNLSSINYTGDFNTQLVLANYTLSFFKKYKSTVFGKRDKKMQTTTQIQLNKPSLLTSTPNLYPDLQLINDSGLQEEASCSRGILLN